MKEGNHYHYFTFSHLLLQSSCSPGPLAPHVRQSAPSSWEKRQFISFYHRKNHDNIITQLQHLYHFSVFQLTWVDIDKLPFTGSLHCSHWILCFLWIIMIFQLRVMKWMEWLWGVCVWTPYSPCLTGRDSAIYHAGNLLPSLSPGIKQSPKQIKRRPAVATGAAAEAARPLAAPLAPRATKEQTVIPTWLFCRGPHGALIKTGQTLWGGSAGPSPSPLQQHPSHYLRPSHVQGSRKPRRRQGRRPVFLGQRSSIHWQRRQRYSRAVLKLDTWVKTKALW